MQELYIDRQPCDLDDGTLITLDIKSNIFTMVDKIESNRTYSVEELEKRQYPSLWMPLPYTEMRKAPLLEQNEGWETWR